MASTPTAMVAIAAIRTSFDSDAGLPLLKKIRFTVIKWHAITSPISKMDEC